MIWYQQLSVIVLFTWQSYIISRWLLEDKQNRTWFISHELEGFCWSVTLWQSPGHWNENTHMTIRVSIPLQTWDKKWTAQNNRVIHAEPLLSQERQNAEWNAAESQRIERKVTLIHWCTRTENLQQIWLQIQFMTSPWRPWREKPSHSASSEEKFFSLWTWQPSEGPPLKR